MTDTPFVKVEIDDEAIKQQVLKQIEERLANVEYDKLFYSLEDLTYITTFSKGHIMNTFFNDCRFKQIRRKVGRKWVFPVTETNEFLKAWITEQPNE